MNNFVASRINTGRFPGNTNEVAQFIVNNGAVINIEAGEEINFYPGTDLGFSSDPINQVLQEADVDAHINTAHTCTSGNVYEYYPTNTISNGQQQGKMTNAISNKQNILVPVVEKEGARIFPNPAKDEISISFYMAKPDFVSLEITDVSGRKTNQIISNQYISLSHVTKTNNISSLAGGVYFYKLIIGQKIQTFKFIKE
jgi:hypothetical protein